MNLKKIFLGIIIGSVFGIIVVLIMVITYNKSRGKDREGFQLVSNDAKNTEEVRLQQVLVYGDYINLDSTDYILIPLGAQTIEENSGVDKKSNDGFLPYDESFKSYKYNFSSLNFSDYNNIIFYNKRSDSTHLLLEKPAIISKFYFPYYDENYVGEKFWFLIYGIHDHDSNADGYINSDDAEVVFMSDLSGENKTQITPENTQLIDWFVDNDSKTLLLKVRKDSNKDNLFNYYDEIEIFKTSIDNPGMGSQIINQDLRNNIHEILNKIR